MIEQEGGLKQGGIVIQDCLDLLANLVRQNSSNQSLFRESGCVMKLAQSLKSSHEKAGGEEDNDDFPNPQMLKNLWGILAVIRLFLVSGSVGTNLNQKTFQKHGLLQEILDLAFRSTTDPAIRTEALYTCADMIRSNAELQASFAQLLVPVLDGSVHQPETNGATNGVVKVHIIDALLDLVIAAPPSISFNLRLAACECIKAYFSNHTQIRLHFLSRAIEGHVSGEDETANILTTLLRDGAIPGTDPYRIWFASVLLLHLIWNDSDAKSTLMKVTEGDAESGEEVVTCIQTIAGNLMAAIDRDDDARIIIGYFMLLSCWLFEDPMAVDDFLGEASFVQVLMRQVSAGPVSNILPKGLSALLLGILYHYSTKDSPISRRKLHPLLLSGMGREKYLQSLSQLRQHPLIRDYEVFTHGDTPPNQSLESAPYSYFDATFVEFLKDNISKLNRAIDRDPGIEVHVSEEQGIDRDLVDSLRSELEDKAKSLQAAETTLLDLEQKLDLAQGNIRKESETHASDLQRIQQVNLSLQQTHEAEMQKVQADFSSQIQEIQSRLTAQITDLQTQLSISKKSSSDEAERTKEYYERSLSQARTSKTALETRVSTLQKSFDDITRTHASSTKTIAELQDENSNWKKANEALKSSSGKKDARLADLQSNLAKQKEYLEDERTKVGMLEKEVLELEGALKEAQGKLENAEKEPKEKDEARGGLQTELDDLLMILGDLEKKRAADKVCLLCYVKNNDANVLLQKRLKELGEEVSEDEEDDEDEDDEDVD